MNLVEVSQYAQLGGTVVTVIAFIIYLKGRDGEFSRAIIMFNSTIKDYLRESVRVKEKLAKQLQNFADASREQTQMIKDLKHSNTEIFKQLLKAKNPKLYEQIHSDDSEHVGK